MSMEITNNYSNYATSYANSAKKTGSTDSRNEVDGVKTNTIELKTSTSGVTRTEQIKTGFSNINDYSKYLQEKYSYMNTGKNSMSGIPTTVTVSSAFLKKCMNDSKKAKYLEENLASIPDCVSSAISGCQGTLTNLNYNVDANGNISVAISGTNDPDGKITRENAERKVKEKKAAEEKAVERREEEKAAKKRTEKAQIEESMEEAKTDRTSISATGNSMESVTKSIISALSTKVGTDVARFDVKA